MNLITDRTSADVARWRQLRDKGYTAMTSAERLEWLGDPIEIAKSGLAIVNLLSDENYNPAARVQGHWDEDELVVRTSTAGTFKYAQLVLGDASRFENLTLTISYESVRILGTGQSGVRLYWVDSAGITQVSGAVLDAPGSITVNVGRNTDGREKLAVLVYSTRDIKQPIGSTVKYKKLMVELGSTKHSFVPYYTAAPLSAIKGMYSHTDMNRVERAVEFLARKISALGYPCSPTVKTDWTVLDAPPNVDIRRYFNNVAELRAAIPVFSSTPAAPTWGSSLNYVRANQLEKVLEDVGRVARGIEEAWYMPEELFSGEV